MLFFSFFFLSFTPTRCTELTHRRSATSQSPADSGPDAGGADIDRGEDDSRREGWKTLLDQCQAEFTYLMVTPANPMPPRESPPLPTIEDLREGDVYGFQGGQQPLDQPFPQGMRSQQGQIREHSARPAPTASGHASSSGGYPAKNTEAQPAPMIRSSNTDHQSAMYGAAASEWAAQVAMTNRSVDDSVGETGQPLRNMSRAEHGSDGSERRRPTEAEGWDFSEGSFPETSQAHQTQPASTRPDTDVFPTAEILPKSPNRGPLAHRRKSSSSASRRRSSEHELSLSSAAQKAETGSFKLRFGLRGHLDTVRTVIFSGGGSPGEPEICTAGDDGMIKRFHIPDRHFNHASNTDLDVTADFTHRGHNGAVLSLASWSPSPNFSTGGRAQGDGWIFSGGQDATIRVWERGRVDPKATLDGHTDAVWALCVLPVTLGAIFGQSNPYGSPDRILLVSGAADGTVKVWAVSAPPQLTSPQPGSTRRGPGSRGRGNSMSSGSAFPSSPQPTTASNSPFHHTLVHSISRANSTASPTCIAPLSANGESFVVSYSDAAILVYDTRSAEEIGSMASLETYDGTLYTSVNAVAATTIGLEQPHQGGLNEEDASGGGGPTGGGRSMAGSGVEGVIISGHEDRFVMFFDANSGKCSSPSAQRKRNLFFPPHFPITQKDAARSLLLQANAPTTCSPTRRRSRASRSAPTDASLSAPVTTRRSGSGASRSARARRRSRATASCAVRASAQSSGPLTAGGWSAAEGTASSKCSRARGVVTRRRTRRG